MQILDRAIFHIRSILKDAIKYSFQQQALIIADSQSPLAILLTQAYRAALPTAQFIGFDKITPEEIFPVFQKMQRNDLVVLIQSSNFRLKDFRIRVELFEMGLKVIEHPQLARMQNEEVSLYIDSLAYDAEYFHGVGHALKKLVDSAQNGVIESDGLRLFFDCKLEPAKLNIGDYTGMKNIGGQFPIGEVFTEAQCLEAVHGQVKIFAFADNAFLVNKPKIPITLVIEKGRVIDAKNTTPEFDEVIAKIKKDEGEIWLRELGFGMNQAFTPTQIVADVGTYERMCGVHLSLGTKHSVYKKPQFKRGTTWHHVDVFAVTDAVYLDEKNIFVKHQWKI
jgi:hypothetical protein